MGFAAAGATPPLAASAVAGWSTGWSSYWSAVVGSHLGPGLDSRASHLVASLPAASRDLLPLVAVAALGAWQARTGWGPARFAAIWLVAALAGVNAGGLYWPHYYVQLLPALCLLAGIGLASLGRPLVACTAAAVVALPAVVFVVGLATAPDRLQDRMVKYALAYENDRTIARYVRAHTSPTDTVYAFASRADFYFLVQRPAALPYLWGHPLRSVPGAFESLEDMLASSRRPRLVVLFQRRPLRRHASVRLLLARYYRQVWRAPRTGTPVLAATESQPAELTR
jgi:hypothetical protein